MKTNIATILLSALCAVALTGCENPTVNAATGPDRGVSRNLEAERITRLGHRYIFFYTYYCGAYTSVNVIHDPDCPCHKTDSER